MMSSDSLNRFELHGKEYIDEWGISHKYIVFFYRFKYIFLFNFLFILVFVKCIFLFFILKKF